MTRFTVLLTGGRAPATLELTRLFGLAGYRVIVGDSIPWPVAGWSRYVSKRLWWPSPRFDFQGFKEALLASVMAEQVDLLIPTCEEIFYIAKIKRELQAHCTPFVPDFVALQQLHSKMAFIEKGKACGLAVPNTARVTSVNELQQEVAKRPAGAVIKPEYSRFATQTLVRPEPHQLDQVVPTERTPWVVQDFLEGRHFASYTVFQAGEAVLHTDYPIRFTAGQGAAVTFEEAQHAGIEAWIFHFGQKLGLTGQLAFDFVETQAGLYAIECNPRLTSGIHLMRGRPESTVAYLRHESFSGCLRPAPHSAAFLGLPFFIQFPQSFTNRRERETWCRLWQTGHNALFDPQDMTPWLLQGVSMLPVIWRSLSAQVGLIEATTIDIEWNGEGAQ